jgi:hypothetical protein
MLPLSVRWQIQRVFDHQFVASAKSSTLSARAMPKSSTFSAGRCQGAGYGAALRCTAPTSALRVGAVLMLAQP